MFLECDATPTQLEQHRKAKEIRRRLISPDKAKPDQPIALKHPHGINGYQLARIARDAARLAAEKECYERSIRLAIEAEEKRKEDRQLASALEYFLFSDFNNTLKDSNTYPVDFIKTITRVVAKKFNMKPADICSSNRQTKYVVPRHVAMYLARKLTPRSLPEIGRKLGNKDHTSVLNAVRTMPERMRNDPQLCQKVHDLKLELEAFLSNWRESH